MDHTKPDPLYPTRSLGNICPICGKRAYSAGGIHPQCAVAQADAPRQAELAVQKKNAKIAADAVKASGEPTVLKLRDGGKTTKPR